MIVASNNKGKIKEVKSILEGYEVISLKEAGIDIDVVENANSFYGNAQKKAYEIHAICNSPVIADDSGLCVDALDGFPGVLTHRFLGENASDERRNEELLNLMKNKENRTACFVCEMVYYDGKNEIHTKGFLEGRIAYEKRGSNGFGFDEIFEIEDGRTLAELTLEEKNSISARKEALLQLKNKLK